MKETVQLILHLPKTTPKEVFDAWLSSDLHSEMTGGEALCSSVVGDPYSAWAGYITGTNLKLIPNELIEQSWRTSEFAETDEDSHLKLELKEHGDGMELRLTHTNIPEGQTQYYEGWKDNYFTPMIEFFKEYSDF